MGASYFYLRQRLARRRASRKSFEEVLAMRRAITIAVQVVALITVAVMGGVAAAPQEGAPSLPEQLAAQYKVAKFAYKSGQVTITEPGTVLVIQQAGILGVPPISLTLAPATYKDGSLHPPGGLAASMAGKNSRQLPVGDKIYVTKLDVNLKKDRVTFRIIECDTCNGTAQPSSYKSDIFFDFPKGTLQTTSVPDVEDTIAKVFTIDNPAPPAAPASAPQAPAPTAAQPASIQLGQTIDQVVAALGQPEKTVNLGSKQIYVYKDLKVTFVGGKVSDVQ
jgi:hypothetical protein